MPANDSLATAEALTGSSGSMTGTTLDAATEDIFSVSGAYPDHEVWYAWADLPEGIVTINVSPVPAGCYTEAAVWSLSPAAVAGAGIDGAAAYWWGDGTPDPFSVSFDHPGGPCTLGVAMFDFDLSSTDFEFDWSTASRVGFHDDFDGTLAVSGAAPYDGSTLWQTWSPGVGGDPYNSGGLLHLLTPGYLSPTSVFSWPLFPLRCASWTVKLDDVPTATIMQNDFVEIVFNIIGGSNNQNAYRWVIQYFPTTVVPPEGPGLFGEEVVIYTETFVGYPPVAHPGTRSTEMSFDIGVHRYLRIREECHHVRLQYSADGSTWVTHEDHAIPEYYYTSNYRMSLGMRAGYGGGAGSKGFFPFEVKFDYVDCELNVCDCSVVLGGWHVGRAAMSTSGPW